MLNLHFTDSLSLFGYAISKQQRHAKDKLSQIVQVLNWQHAIKDRNARHHPGFPFICFPVGHALSNLSFACCTHKESGLQVN